MHIECRDMRKHKNIIKLSEYSVYKNNRKHFSTCLQFIPIHILSFHLIAVSHYSLNHNRLFLLNDHSKISFEIDKCTSP